MDDFPPGKGVVTCTKHFVCNDCLVQQFKILAQQPGLESFPAQCCNEEIPINIMLIEHLLSAEVIEAYRIKEMEFSTPPTLRVYCSNIECHAWIPPSESWIHPGEFQERSTEVCKCGTTTCVGCKNRWVPGHTCGQDQEEKPSWLPEYAAWCRIKKCPSCRSFIELYAACNHVTCNVCQHQFCWVCLMEWTGFHSGCSQYGDPEYDEEGFERNTRGLHRDTGLTREGKTFLELRGTEPFPAPQAPQADGGQWFFDPNEDVYFQMANYNEEVHVDEPGVDENVENAYVEDEVAENEYADFYQLECRHFWGWTVHNLSCNFCLLTPEGIQGHHNCSECGVRACRSCFLDQFMHYNDPHGYADDMPELFNLVGVIQWAEEGVAPFREPERRYRGRWAIPNEEQILLGMQTLFEQAYEAIDPIHGLEWLFQEPDDWTVGAVDEDRPEIR